MIFLIAQLATNMIQVLVSDLVQISEFGSSLAVGKKPLARILDAVARANAKEARIKKRADTAICPGGFGVPGMNILPGGGNSAGRSVVGAGVGPAAGSGAAGALRKISSTSAPASANTRGASVEFRNVAFRYPTHPDRRVLRDISFVAHPGEKIAFVGSSGCGKSTAIQLLGGVYEPDGGTIFIDGVPLPKIYPDSYGRMMSWVVQEPVLFQGTLRENLLWGAEELFGCDFDVEEQDLHDSDIEKGNATKQVVKIMKNLSSSKGIKLPSDEDILAACELAKVKDVILRLPNGLDTQISGSAQFSGGQKQRLAIARALIRKPRLLLLDEATSALDYATERAVLANLRSFAARLGMTTIVIAHRLGTIQDADQILFFGDNGRVVEQGTHAELLALANHTGSGSGVESSSEVESLGGPVDHVLAERQGSGGSGHDEHSTMVVGQLKTPPRKNRRGEVGPAHRARAAGGGRGGRYAELVQVEKDAFAGNRGLRALSPPGRRESRSSRDEDEELVKHLKRGPRLHGAGQTYQSTSRRVSWTTTGTAHSRRVSLSAEEDGADELLSVAVDVALARDADAHYPHHGPVLSTIFREESDYRPPLLHSFSASTAPVLTAASQAPFSALMQTFSRPDGGGSSSARGGRAPAPGGTTRGADRDHPAAAPSSPHFGANARHFGRGETSPPSTPKHHTTLSGAADHASSYDGDDRRSDRRSWTDLEDPTPPLELTPNDDHPQTPRLRGTNMAVKWKGTTPDSTDKDISSPLALVPVDETGTGPAVAPFLCSSEEHDPTTSPGKKPSILTRIWRLNSPFQKFLLLVTVVLALQRGASLFGFFFVFMRDSAEIPELRRKATINRQLEFLNTMFLTMFFVGPVGMLVGDVFRAIIRGTVEAQLVRSLRAKVFRKLLSNEMSFYDCPEHRPKRLLVILQVGASKVAAVLYAAFGSLAQAAGGFVSAFVCSFVHYWPVALSAAAITLICFAMAMPLLFFSLLGRINSEDNLAAAARGSEALANVRALRSVRGSEAKFFGILDGHFVAHYETRLRQLPWQALQVGGCSHLIMMIFPLGHERNYVFAFLFQDLMLQQEQVWLKLSLRSLLHSASFDLARTSGYNNLRIPFDDG